MGKIIAVVSGKGGTGKTSFTANVGLALAERGHRVLCVDCDIIMRNLDLALGLSDSAMMDFCDVMSGNCSLEDAVAVHRKYPSLHLLTAPGTYAAMQVTAPQLKKLYEDVRERYDFCLVDAPAGLGVGFHLATAYADNVVVVTTTDNSALRDAQRTVIELNRFRKGTVHLVVGRVQKKMLTQLHTTIDDAIDTAGLPLIGVIPEDSDVSTALNRGIPLRDFNFYAARAYENIARRLCGEKVPLMKI
jgi:septum site-determining protein MinD